MVKIKVLDRGFPTTNFGYLEARKVYEVTPHFADYCVKQMKAAEFVKVEKPVKKSKK